MSNDYVNKFLDYIFFPKGLQRLYSIVILAAFIGLVYFFVYQTGGTKYVYSHTMYIPIILSTISFGVKGGVITGLVAGILLGPLMPLDTINNEMQKTFNWVYRLVIFLLVGVISGMMSNIFRINTKKVVKLLTHNQYSGLPNANILNKDILINNEDFSVNTKLVMTIIINNHENIIELISKSNYFKLVKEIYIRIGKILGNDVRIIHAENNKLWLCLFKEDIDFYINNILNTLNTTFYIDRIPLYVEFSMGIAGLNDGNDLIVAFKHADASAYNAQKLNLRYQIFESKHLIHKKNIELLGMFHKALNNDELEVYYQPKIDLRTNKPIGLEALLRWKVPSIGMISPMKIIPLVEETQLINPLTNWVLSQSLIQLHDLKECGIETTISVNISTKNLYYPNFFDEVVDLLNDHNVKEYSIEFEITESALMANPNASIDLLRNLKENRIMLSIDDYGTGYSSLSYLSQLPINIVKIDKYFINQMNKDLGVKHIVKSTIDLVHKLGMKVLAEGVEQLEHVNSLIEMGCDYAQGYYYAIPMNKTEIIEWYQKNK